MNHGVFSTLKKKRGFPVVAIAAARNLLVRNPLHPKKALDCNGGGFLFTVS